MEVTFPEEYHASNLAGKAAEFKCMIHEIRIKSAYEMDDTFAREVGGCENLSQMREKMRRSLQNYSDERGEMELQEVLIRKAADTLEFTPSEEQIQAEMDEQIPDKVKSERFDRLLACQNAISLEQNKPLEGKMLRVLCDGRSKNNSDVFSGRNEGNKIVFFDGEDSDTGKFLNVHIERADTFALYGKIVK